MQAGILCKKIIKSVVTFSAFAFVTVCLLYAYTVYNADVVRMANGYSFVVKSYDSVEVGTFETEQMGGAGYWLDMDGSMAVAVGVYASVATAERVQNTLGDTYAVHTVHANDLYFTTRKEKQNAQTYKNAFSSLDGCIQVLAQEIDRLEAGATQQSTKRVLGELKRQFAYLQKEYANSYPRFVDVCKIAEERLQRETEEIVYAQKLRYVLCELCVQYCQLAEQFLP